MPGANLRIRSRPTVLLRFKGGGGGIRDGLVWDGLVEWIFDFWDWKMIKIGRSVSSRILIFPF